MRRLAAVTAVVLRGTSAPPADRRALVLLALTGGALYGAAMGAWSGSLAQVVFSAIKVPLLLAVTFALSLPSFFVLNTLLGVRRADFFRALAVLVAAQAAFSILLAALAPFTLFWYAAGLGYGQAILFNGAVFAVATLAAQIAQRRGYAPLLAAHPAHRPLLRIWGVLYAFVGVQMAWTLRPFVGEPVRAATFFRPDALGNAYVALARIVWRALGGG